MALFGGDASAAEPVAKIETRLVLVPVTVTDRNGKPLMDLQAGDFRISDGDQPRPVHSLAREDAPVSVGIVVDLSGSMRNKLQEAMTAVREIATALDDDDRAALITFADRPEMVLEFTQEPGLLAERLRGASAEGRTALIDAVYMAVQKVKATAGPRKAVVVISDGGDNYSRYTEKELTSMLIESDVQVYSVSIVENASNREEQRGVFLLKGLSNITGGLHFTVRFRADLPAAAQKIARAMKNVYVIGYQPPAGSAPGKWRRIHVTINSPSRRSLRVSARHGYYEPN